MPILMCLLTIPFALALGLLFNTYGDLSHRSSEQVRLDAYTLSICHKRANFILNRLMPTNREIQVLQQEMDLAAAACEDVEAVPELAVEVCAASLLVIQTSSAAGAALENEQDIARANYAQISSEVRENLREKNRLDPHHGSLQIDRPAWESLSLYDGFDREVISPLRETREMKYGASWPHPLIPNMQFSEIHNISTSFRPDRTMLDSDSKDQSGVMKYSRRRVKEGGASHTRSGCRINENTYDVRRTR